MFAKSILFVGVLALANASVLRKLTAAQEERLANWKDGDKQSIWELSGQHEGDIVLNPRQRNGILHGVYRWPDNNIPYEFAPSVTEEQRRQVNEAVKIFGAETCFTAKPRNGEGNYLYITNEPTGCWSYVGRQAGKQQLNLQSSEPGTGCFADGNILHEFLHAIGFFHMQNSIDRDDFVEIQWENISEEDRANFEKLSPRDSTTYNEKYDYESILHFGAYAFTTNGEKTIITKDPEAIIGQRNHLSASDLAKVYKMSVCDYWGTTTASPEAKA